MKTISFSHGVELDVLQLDRKDFAHVKTGESRMFRNRTHPLFTQERQAKVVDTLERLGQYHVKVEWE